jgi:hypothetical protein
MAGTLTIGGTQTGAPEGNRTISTTLTMGVCGVMTEVTLASGANTITVPTNAAGCVIIPPSGNTQTLTLKGVTGDTGIALSKTNPFMLAFDSTPPASFVITAGALTTGITAIIFF